MKRKRERGQAILEFAIILPVFLLIGFGLCDVQWCLSRAANLEYIVNETARCMAVQALPCTELGSPNSYAMMLGENLKMVPAQMKIIPVPLCNPSTGICKITMTYQYEPIGAYFPKVLIERTGVAAKP